MIRIINDRVAIVPIENPDKIGSLWVPEIAKERLNQGFVKYKGPDVQGVKVGDYVLFSGYTGTLTYIEGEGKLIIMPEEFIVATIGFDRAASYTEIEGLYFKDRHGEYFPANYEVIMEYIADTFSRNKEWRNQIIIKDEVERPKPEDYDRLGTGAGGGGTADFS